MRNVDSADSALEVRDEAVGGVGKQAWDDEELVVGADGTVAVADNGHETKAADEVTVSGVARVALKWRECLVWQFMGYADHGNDIGSLRLEDPRRWGRHKRLGRTVGAVVADAGHVGGGSHRAERQGQAGQRDVEESHCVGLGESISTVSGLERVWVRDLR